MYPITVLNDTRSIPYTVNSITQNKELQSASTPFKFSLAAILCCRKRPPGCCTSTRNALKRRNRYKTPSKRRRLYRTAFSIWKRCTVQPASFPRRFSSYDSHFGIFWGFRAHPSSQEGRGSLRWQKIPSLTTNKHFKSVQLSSPFHPP